MFNTSKRLNKLLACFLTALLLMSNTVALVPAYAAASANTSEQTSELPEITLDKQVEDQFQNNQNADMANLSTKQKVVQFINQFIPYYAQNGKQQGPEWLRTTDINFTFTEDLKPVYSLETLQPFTKEVTDGKLGFWQGRYAYQSGANSTANLGIGLRWLSEDKTSITGINTFYDYAFEHNLSRVGIGAEHFNKQAEYRANFYIPTSGDRQTGKTALADGILYSYIRAVSGFDYEVGTSLANAPWLSLYASGFHYDNKHKEDENGYRLRSKMQLTPRLSMEMGYTNSNLSSGSLYGKVLYHLADTVGPALRGGSAKELSNDISHKLLQKVQRENEIKTETFTKFVAYSGSLSVTVTSGGAALQGAQVQAYQNGSPVGAAAVTGPTGTAELRGLAVGEEYTVRATYFSVSDTRTAVVQKDQTVNIPIPLDVLSGKAKITVFDNAGAGVGGATVTAEAADGLHGAADKSLFDRILGVKTAYAAAAFTVTAVTDASGIATFTNLPPGNYKFTVIYSGKEMKSLAVGVAVGSTSNSTVVLPASGGNIVAMIIDAVSKAVINGAAVELKSGSTVIDTKTTDSDGTAVFSGLTAGSTYTVAANAANYSGKSISTTVTDKETVAAAIALTPQTGGATITVTDGINPVSGATVSVPGNSQIPEVTTDSKGVATFTNIPTGTYVFTATKADYVSGTKDVAIASGATASADIALSRQTGGATITVKDGETLLKDVTVSVKVNGKDQTATTLENGEATFANIPTGTYTFSASIVGYDSGTQDVTIASGATATATIALTRQNANVTITVIGADNQPIGEATVTATLEGVTISTATTTSEGKAIFTNLPTGYYKFIITKAGYSNSSVSTTVERDETYEILLIRPSGKATITVIGIDKKPISGVTVSTLVQGVTTEKTTDASGIAVFTELPTATYSFTATQDGYDSVTTDGITVLGSSHKTATITLSPKIITAQVNVKDGAGNNMVRYTSVRVTGNGVDQTKTTDASGNVTFSLPAGQYLFAAAYTNDGFYNNDSKTILLSDETSSVNLTIIRKVGSLTLIVKDKASQQPISGAEISVSYSDPKIVLGYTDGEGKFILANVSTGQTYYTANKVGYTGMISGVTVNEGTNEQVIELPSLTGNLTIRVRDSAKSGIAAQIPGATVIVKGKSNGVSQTATANEVGNAVFQNLPLGSYTVSVSITGYASASIDLAINEGSNSQTVNITASLINIGVYVNEYNPGNPMSMLGGVTVTITHESGYSETRTTTAGVLDCNFNNVPSGRYTFVLQKPGYKTITEDRVLPDAEGLTAPVFVMFKN